MWTKIFVFIFCSNYNFIKYTEAQNNEEVDDLVQQIEKTMKYARNYQFPKDSSIHKAKTNKIQSLEPVDYVVIGGGPGGSVMANRLSKNFKVLLLEAGDFENNITKIPVMPAYTKFTPYNWGYLSVPQKTTCLGLKESRCPIPRGKGLGGTSLLNGLIYSRFNKLDFDKWAEVIHPDWSYKNVIEYFKKSEHYNHRNPDAPFNSSVHGYDGPFNVEYILPGNKEQLQAFLSGNQELGMQIIDYNGGNGLGVSQTQCNNLEGTRFDNGRAYVLPILERKNLKVLTNAFVTKIIIVGFRPRAEGVIFTYQNKTYKIKAKKEVILSAGSINSAQILMLSGIGPKKHLKSLKIPVKKDLPVGSQLFDHPSFYGLNFNSNITTPQKSLSDLVKEYLNGKGQLTGVDVNNQALGFYESSYTKGQGLPDIEIMFNPTPFPNDLLQQGLNLNDELYEDIFSNINPKTTFSMYPIKLHAKSKGSVRLKSSDPFEFPLVNLNLLSDPNNEDINTLYEGIQLVFKLVETKAFQEIGAQYVGKPIRACKKHEYLSKEYWMCSLRQFCIDAYHPMGTTPMGKDPKDGAVVDHKCRVHGVKSLRVVDAGVFPFAGAGHMVANIVMIGEKIPADIINN